MISNFKIYKYNYNTVHADICIPHLNKLKSDYEHAQLNSIETGFPFWGQIWESAIALSDFIVDNPIFFSGKSVLELAAGLGLPSIISSHYADSVICSDYANEAFPYIEKSIAINTIQNITTMNIDWNHIPTTLNPDVILISDLNYEPQYFDSLYIAIKEILDKGITIFLSTPQRLLAKPFITKLLPFVIYQEERAIQIMGKNIEYINIYQLKK